MAYDEDLADRIRAVLQKQDGVTEKRMFGGLARAGSFSESIRPRPIRWCARLA